MTKEQRQSLFNYMAEQHEIILLESEMDTIENIINPIPMPYTMGQEPKQSWVDYTFWKRLNGFMENIQVNDLAGEE